MNHSIGDFHRIFIGIIYSQQQVRTIVNQHCGAVHLCTLVASEHHTYVNIHKPTYQSNIPLCRFEATEAPWTDTSQLHHTMKAIRSVDFSNTYSTAFVHHGRSFLVSVQPFSNFFFVAEFFIVVPSVAISSFLFELISGNGIFSFGTSIFICYRVLIFQKQIVYKYSWLTVIP